MKPTTTTSTLLALLPALAASQSPSSSSASAPVSAQTTLSLYIPNADQQPLVASILSAAPPATTYRISCPPGEDSSDCGFGPGAEITQSGSAGYAGTMSAGDFSMTWSCSVAGTTQAICTESAGGAEANAPGVSTVTYTGPEAMLMPVTVTAGVEKLGASSSSAASGSGEGGSKTTLSGTAKDAGATQTGSASSPSASGNVGLRVVEKVVVVVGVVAGAGYALV